MIQAIFVLPKLKNEYSAYEPYLDTKTMEIHHGKHHAGYVSKLNQAMIDIDIQKERVEDFFENINDYPQVIRNNAGGHYNHTVFWSVINPSSVATPNEQLTEAINHSFGSLEQLKHEVLTKAASVFGSGWCWLVVDDKRTLKVVTTKNQDNPLMSDIAEGYPILGIDVWEHAYYLQYQNNRGEYLDRIWNLLNWQEISNRFENMPELLDLM